MRASLVVLGVTVAFIAIVCALLGSWNEVGRASDPALTQEQLGARNTLNQMDVDMVLLLVGVPVAVALFFSSNNSRPGSDSK